MAHQPDPEEMHVDEPHGAEPNPNPNLPDEEPHDSDVSDDSGKCVEMIAYCIH